MPRKKRIWYPGAVYHVMSRGNRRTSIFEEEADYLEFLECLLMLKESFGFIIHALCLMTNHFHIAMGTKDIELWKIMHKLLRMYAGNYNIKYGLTGHLFENRYNAQLIENERYFLEVSRYIHLNPVRAMIVQEPAAYQYSSYARFVNTAGPDGVTPRAKSARLISELVETSRVLGYFRDNSEERYRKFVEEKKSHDEQEQLIQKAIREDDLY